MESLVRMGTFSILMAAFASPIFADQQPTTTDMSPAIKAADKVKPRFTISKETTRLTEPLRADGRVDYVAALNKIYSTGVTPENNAVVLLLQAVGPNIISSNYREQNYRMLGIEPLPEKGDYLIPYEKFQSESKTEQDKKEEEAVGKEPAEQQKQFDQFHEIMSAPWTAAKYPRYAEWLKANEKPLEKIYELSLRPKYYAPMISGDDEYATVIAVRLPLTQGSRTCTDFLWLMRCFRQGKAKSPTPSADILACHRLARLVGQEAFIVDVLVAIAIDGMACKGDTALAQSGKMSIRQMDAFREELKKLPRMPKIADKLDVAERFAFLDCVQMLAVKGIDSISALTGGGVSNTKDSLLRSIFTMAVFSTSDWDGILRRGNTWYDRIAEAARKPTFAKRTNELYKIDAEIKTFSEEVKSLKNVGSSLMAGEAIHTIASKKIGDILISLLTPALNAAIHVEECSNVNSDLSQIAFALDTFRSEHGNYPDRLADLGPKYILEVPKDGFTSADYIYHRKGNGYILYSVGYNHKDDGGKSRNNDPPDEAGDDLVVRCTNGTK